MSIGPGLFRAGIVVSILWIAVSGPVAYLAVSPDTVGGSYRQPVN